jgi:AcrR family transcriptional regulator
MSETTSKRLPKAERREQLLDTALKIVRDEGTDALTLGHLAERAGVSKPIAYEHFTSRSGLLIALYRQMNDRHVAALTRALGCARRRLKDVAAVMGRAYVECYASIGPEWLAVSAAMKGDEEMEAFQQAQLDDYVALYREALAPYADLPEGELYLRCVGIVGAGEAISHELTRGRVSEAAAAECLASLIARWLK